MSEDARAILASEARDAGMVESDVVRVVGVRDGRGGVLVERGRGARFERGGDRRDLERSGRSR